MVIQTLMDFGICKAIILSSFSSSGFHSSNSSFKAFKKELISLSWIGNQDDNFKVPSAYNSLNDCNHFCFDIHKISYSIKAGLSSLNPPKHSIFYKNKTMMAHLVPKRTIENSSFVMKNICQCWTCQISNEIL